VAGRYQPLADDVTIAGDVRPNLSPAVVQKTKRNALLEVPFGFDFCAEALGGNRRRAYRLCHRKSSGFARDFWPISLPLPYSVVIFPWGRGVSLATPSDLSTT
jgi:hypothetical protein